MNLFSTLVVLLMATPIQAQTSSWFTLLPQVTNSWRVQNLDGKPNQLLITPATAKGDDEPYRVMVLFPKESSAYDIAMAQILITFSEKKLSSQFLLINFAGEEAAGIAALEQAARDNFNLIFSMGSNSTSFVVEHDQAKRVPVVTVCSKDPVLMGQMPDYESGSGTNVAFTSLDLPIDGQMAYLKRLRPSLAQLAVLYARNNISAVKTQVEPLVLACKREHIALLEVVVEDQAKAAEELAIKVPQAAAAMAASDPELSNSIFWITGSTSVFNEIATINAGSGKVPVLSVVPNVVGAGDDSAVLSIGVSFENNAQLAALYGVRILTRQVKAGELKVGVVSPPDIAINFKKARQIGLKIPFSFFESASFVYDQDGVLVREKGQNIK